MEGMEDGLQTMMSETEPPKPLDVVCILSDQFYLTLNTMKPEFTIVIFIHYKPRIAVVILDL